MSKENFLKVQMKLDGRTIAVNSHSEGLDASILMVTAAMQIVCKNYDLKMSELIFKVLLMEEIMNSQKAGEIFTKF